MLAKEKIKQLKKELAVLENLQFKYLGLKIEETWDGNLYCSPTVNTEVDHFELIDQDTYALYIIDNKIKIYGDPYCFSTMTDESYEVDWLKDIEKFHFNRKTLVKIMKKFNSHYLNSPYYKEKYPWVELY